jgi:glycyl-tRNA synthetase
MEDVVNLCKRRGFVFAGSEIYGGLAGTFDYGPYGIELRNNIKNLWWKMFIHEREDMFGIETSLISSQKIWEASGHLSGFNDPVTEDVKTKKRYRADHLLEDNDVDVTGMKVEEMNKILREKGIKSPDGNELTDIKSFNMMFPLKMGASDDSSSIAYLRGETAQGMFTNFKNIVDTIYPNLPFGLGQIGKCFRNEIAPRDFIFRLRELEIMELEYFTEEKNWQRDFEMWLEFSRKWFKAIGLPDGSVHEKEIGDGDRAHYSKRTVDFEYDYPTFGIKEIGGLAYRTDFDLQNHIRASGEKLEYRFKDGSGVVVPHCIEPTYGLDRNFLAILCAAYNEEGEGEEKRVFLKLPKELAPVQIAVFPLLKNKENLTTKAREVFVELKKKYGKVVYDDNANIGKRYRRQDEIGTPYCVTVDFETLEDDTITIRERDTGAQKRVKIAEIENFLK